MTGLGRWQKQAGSGNGGETGLAEVVGTEVEAKKRGISLWRLNCKAVTLRLCSVTVWRWATGAWAAGRLNK